MIKPDRSRWIKLVLHTEETNSYFSYEDGLKHRLNGPFEDYKEMSFEGETIRYSAKMDEDIQAVYNAEPKVHYTAEDGNKPIPLAVYIYVNDGDPRYESLFIQRLVDHYLFELLKDKNFQTVFYQYEGETAAIPFSLPFNIRTAGESSDGMLTKIKNANWYKNNIEVAEFGMSMKDIKASNEDIDILVVDYKELRTYVDSPFFKERKPPRLIVLIISGDVLNDSEYYDLVFGLYTAFLYIASRDHGQISSFLSDFIYNLIHDYPLHESLHSALQKGNEKEILASLAASPVSNHGLRMSDAVESFKNEVYDYNKTINPGNLNDFLGKFTSEQSYIADVIKNSLSGGFTGMAGSSHDYGKGTGGMQNFFNQIKTSDLYFIGESTGLVPMSKAKDFFSQMKPQLQEYRDKGLLIVNNKEYFQVIRENQERKADITLEEWGDYLLYSPIGKTKTLRAGGQYRLNVSIGQPSQYSLIEGELPSIDPLLPDPENENGHDLDIVVYAKDFTLLSPSCQSVNLPLLGGTDIVRFIIKAPVDMSEASLRVAIFYKNNLLQAFVLEAIVEPQSRWIDKTAVKVMLDLSTSQKFTNLDDLQSPALYIGMNKNTDGSHSLFLKKEDFVLAIDQLPDTIYDDAQTEFRELLTRTYFNEREQSRFSFTDGKIVFSGDFPASLRKLGRLGRKYYNKIFNYANEELEDQLNAVRDPASTNKKIQVGRHNPNYAFPWPILYDYNAPPPVTMDNYPVCYGKKFADGEHNAFKNKEDIYGCPHNPNTHTWCIEGFWGIRNTIEQLFKTSSPVDAANPVVQSKPGIIYGCNFKDNFTNPLTEKMKSSPSVTILEPGSDLMSDLWNNQRRPSSLVMLGHLQKETVSDEPDSPRIITFPHEDWTLPRPIPESKWIYSDLIFSYRSTNKKWAAQPFPIVFLINCSSGDLNIRSVNSMVEEFNKAGASAVIATECDITTGLGVLFIEHMLNSLYKDGKELGEAIRDFNRSLVQSSLPLAFVFTCYGNINLTIK